jgi:hypothetical protein
MKSRYDDRSSFVARLAPLIRRQIELHRVDPDGYARELPLKMHSHFVERSPWVMTMIPRSSRSGRHPRSRERGCVN